MQLTQRASQVVQREYSSCICNGHVC